MDIINTLKHKQWIFTRRYNDIYHFETSDIWNANVNGGFVEYNKSTNELKITTKDGGYNSDGPVVSVKFKGKCNNSEELNFILNAIG